MQELNGSNGVVANMLTGLNIDEYPSASLSAGFERSEPGCCGPLSYLSDALGSTLALTDSSGTVQNQYQYEPFGNAWSPVSNNTSTNSYQFTGRENDGESGYDLDYYRGRYYSPVFQRFISQDPVDILGGDTNLYAYVGNSPVNLIDLLGLLTQDEVGLILFNEFGNSFSGDGLFTAEVAVAHTIINGASGPRGDAGRPKSANPIIPYPLTPAVASRLDRALDAAAQAERENSCHIDPTHGPTHFGFVGPSTPEKGAFKSPVPYHGNPAYGVEELIGPFNNSFTRGDVPDANPYVLIYSGP